MTQQRACTQCGTTYAPEDQTVLCSVLQASDGGSVTTCAGDIMPKPTIPSSPYACLLCLDTGTVHSWATDESWRCPRSCKAEA